MSARCLACGGEAVARERRVLNSEATHNVVAAWKEIVQLKAIELTARVVIRRVLRDCGDGTV